MKKTNEILLKDAIEAFLKENHIDQKFNETRLISCWQSVVGNLIARHTLQLQIRKKTLFVKVDNAALRQELNYQKGNILEKLNSEVDMRVIDEIVIT